MHAAKRVGGPWGAPCSRVKPGLNRAPESNDDFEPVEYGYDGGEFECECPSQGSHLLELLEREYASDLSALQARGRE